MTERRCRTCDNWCKHAEGTEFVEARISEWEKAEQYRSIHMRMNLTAEDLLRDQNALPTRRAAFVATLLAANDDRGECRGRPPRRTDPPFPTTRGDSWCGRWTAKVKR